MIGFNGRLGFKQYIPMKPTKSGIKVWVCADPHSGYVNDFDVYTGKDSDGPTKDLAEKVVKALVEPLYGMNHTVYMDNYFSSVPLYMDLLQNGTYTCGTFRRGQVGIPTEVTEVRLKNQGEHLMMQRDNLVATAWQDKRTVYILSTNSDPTVWCTLERQIRCCS